MENTNILNWLNGYHGHAVFILQCGIVVLLTLSLNFIASRIYKRAVKKLTLTPRIWDDSLIKAAYRPIQWAIVLLGVSILVTIIDDATQEYFVFTYVPLIRKILMIMLLAWFAVRFIRFGEENVYKHNQDNERFDDTTAHAIAKLSRVVVFILAGLMILQTMQVNISGLLAFGGIGGVIVGLSAKDMLANFFGALAIYLDRPFAVGDWVRSPDRNIEGTVENIGWRLTRIRTFEKRPLYVPNAVFSTIIIENPSRMLNRRIKELIGIRYQDKPKIPAILEDVEAMLKNNSEVDQELTIRAKVMQFGPSSIDFCLYCFTKTTVFKEYLVVKQDILLKTMDIIQKHGADMAFPTTTVHLHQEAQNSSS